MSLLNKVALVTGASSGIGAAIAAKFAKEGAKVAIIGRNTVKLNNVAKECSNPLVIAADVTKEEDAKRLVNETVKHFGKLDILVNNAGIGGTASILSEDAMASFDKIMATNLRSAVHLTHLTAPHLLKTKGNIINISSVAALTLLGKGSYAYCASKAGLDHFSRSIAQELASKGIRVNTVNPGPVRTDIVKNFGATGELEELIFKQMQQATLLKRVSDPEEIADLVLFLASDKARGITGSSFVSDNGALLKTGEKVDFEKSN